MLADPRAERRYAAAIVLAELKAKDPPTVKALTAAIDGEDRRLCRYAVEALAEARAVKAVPSVVPLLVDPDPEVRRAAETFLLAAGDSATAVLQKQLKDGGPDMRRAVASILAKLGGQTGLDALIGSIDGTDPNLLDRTRAALARAVQTLDGGDARELAAKLHVRCKELVKRGDAEGAGAALRALGEIGSSQADALSILRSYAGPSHPGPVRRGALSALGKPIAESKPGKKRDAVIEELLGYLSEESYEDVVRPALTALHSAPVPAELVGKLVKLLGAPQPAARQLAIRKLGEIGSAVAARALVRVLSIGDQVSKSAAREAIAKLPQASPLLLDALLDAGTVEEARMLASVLRGRASELSKADRSRLAEGALDALVAGLPRAEALSEIARSASGSILCSAAIERAHKLRKKGDTKGAVAVLRAVSSLPGFDDAARFELAVMGLAGATGPVVRVARSTDPVLGPFVTLLESGFPLPAKLAKERSIGDEELFFLGFAFAESNDDTERELGCEVLSIVADRSPRSKLGKSAKNKIRLMAGS
ncbi:MAG: HEAT repeat domain-containing protein [Deltaproteobacteria bacterium]|nr:HEAT repeat domain-containing protein [Deltaproteobacteria bacterium]